MHSGAPERAWQREPPDSLCWNRDEPTHTQDLAVSLADDLHVTPGDADNASGRKRIQMKRFAFGVKDDLEVDLAEVADVVGGGIRELDDGLIERATFVSTDVEEVAEPSLSPPSAGTSSTVNPEWPRVPRIGRIPSGMSRARRKAWPLGTERSREGK
jgi:hypothetical protein